jgi:DNA-binding IclR family transcriptional regulator
MQDRLKVELEDVKNRGYSLINEEYLPGLNAIGAPLFNFKKKKVLGAVSFDFPAENNSIESIQNNYSDAIKKIANNLSEMITVADD